MALLVAPVHAEAWGERGHDLVTRVAVRVALARSGNDPALVAALSGKDHMLGHLANVPDIVWRNRGKELEARNAPTHFLDVEYVATEARYEALPKTIAGLEARIVELCAKKPAGYVCPERRGEAPLATRAGTAPWRVAQLAALARDGFAAAKSPSKGTERNAAVDRALLHMGLLSHFVGDLANPHHTSRDYDGWERDQGGAHAYFEREVVDTYDFTLDQDVLRAALDDKPFETRVLARLPAAERARLADDPLAVGLALTLDSHAHVAELYALDKAHAVTKAGSNAKGLRIKAERKPPAEAAPRFRALVVARLATAADTLAHLWLWSYRAAGAPDLTGYQSYAYEVEPAFIEPPAP